MNLFNLAFKVKNAFPELLIDAKELEKWNIPALFLGGPFQPWHRQPQRTSVEVVAYRDLVRRSSNAVIGLEKNISFRVER